jgi:hypothetical protein
MRRHSRAFIAIFWVLSVFAQAEGGSAGGGAAAIGLAERNGAWYFTAPNGDPFLSRGICVIRERDDAVRPGSRGYDGASSAGAASAPADATAAWAEATARNLRAWGFDTIGCWSSDRMRGLGLYATDIMNLRIERDGKMKDVFSPLFEGEAAVLAERLAERHRGDAQLIGYFLENEQPWWGDYGWYTGHAPTLLDAYLGMPTRSPGREAALDYLRSAYADVSGFNAAHGTSYSSWKELERRGLPSLPSPALSADRNAFAGLVARRYYAVATGALRKRDPGRLILGDRFANYAPREVVRACGEHCDVVSLNYYLGYRSVSPEYLKGFAELSGRPLLITEFSYRATENRSGDKNTKGADVTVATQADRAEGYARYVSSLARLPFVVGWHWFQFYDESPGGRSFDGEDSDYGVVDIDGRPYEELVAAMRETNAAAPALHARSAETPVGKAVFADEPIAVERSGTRAERSASVLSVRPRMWGWADAGAGARIDAKQADKGIAADYDSGSGWGCGFSFAPALNGDATAEYEDLSSFEGLELVFKGKSGLKVSIFITEQGADEPWKVEYRGAEGSDGESFTTEPLALQEKATRVRLPFELFGLRSSFGNQSGNHRIDLKAVRSIDVYVSGGQGKGRLELLSCSAY